MSICVNHTSRAATARCSSCHKPICDDCIIKANGAVFCSQKCVEGAARFKNFQNNSSPGLFGSIAKMIKTAVGLVVVLVVLIFIGAKILNLGICKDILKHFGL